LYTPGCGAWARLRERRIDAIRDDGGFVGHMESIIALRDDAQRTVIRPYFEATDARNRAIIAGAQDDLESALEDMRALI